MDVRAVCFHWSLFVVTTRVLTFWAQNASFSFYGIAVRSGLLSLTTESVFTSMDSLASSACYEQF